MKKSTKTLIIVLSIICGVIILSCCGCSALIMLLPTPETSESSSSDSPTNSTTVTSTVTTTETTSTTTSTTKTTQTTTATTTSQTTTQTTTTTTASTISDEEYINIIFDAVKDDVGEGENITDITYKDNKVTIYVDFSNANDSILTPEDIAISRASSITDSFLELAEYDYMWDKITVDFGDVGSVTRYKKDIVDSLFGRYFDIDTIER